MAAAISTYQPTVIYKVTIKATGQTFYAAPSGANDGTCYRVRRQGAGLLSCSCPDHQYRKRACKHILAVADLVACQEQARADLEAERADALALLDRDTTADEWEEDARPEAEKQAEAERRAEYLRQQARAEIARQAALDQPDDFTDLDYYAAYTGHY